MRSFRKKTLCHFTLSWDFQLSRLAPIFLCILVFFLCSNISKAEPLTLRLKAFTRVLSIRNLDSLRLFIDPNRIYVEITPKEGAYLSPSQTLVVVETFFQSHSPISFSYGLVKEQGKTGIALGTLVVSENGRTVFYKVSFGFQKDAKSTWLMSRISIH